MTTQTAEKPLVSLDWSLDVDCPKCGKEIDLVAYDSEHDYIIANKIFNNKWDDVEGCDVTCPHCEHEFELGKVEY